MAGSLSLNTFTLSSIDNGNTPGLNVDSTLTLIIGTGSALKNNDFIKFSFSGYTFNYGGYSTIPLTEYKSSTSSSLLGATTTNIIKGNTITFSFNILKISPCV